MTRLARFDDHHRDLPVLVLDLGYITLKFRHLMRYDPGLWVETEVDRVLIFHLLEATGQICFLSNATHGREVVYLLEGFELSELLLRDSHVVPDDIDVRVS